MHSNKVNTKLKIPPNSLMASRKDRYIKVIPCSKMQYVSWLIKNSYTSYYCFIIKCDRKFLPNNKYHGGGVICVFLCMCVCTCLSKIISKYGTMYVRMSGKFEKLKVAKTESDVGSFMYKQYTDMKQTSTS